MHNDHGFRGHKIVIIEEHVVDLIVPPYKKAMLGSYSSLKETTDAYFLKSSAQLKHITLRHQNDLIN